jgi:hypothetical protein
MENAKPIYGDMQIGHFYNQTAATLAGDDGTAQLDSRSPPGSIVLANSAVYVNSIELCASCFSGVTKYE